MSPLGSILDARVVCQCGWLGTVRECVPDAGGDGSLGCPKPDCGLIVTEAER